MNHLEVLLVQSQRFGLWKHKKQLQEQERLAYISGNTTLASALALMVDAYDEGCADTALENEDISDS